MLGVGIYYICSDERYIYSGYIIYVAMSDISIRGILYMQLFGVYYICSNERYVAIRGILRMEQYAIYCDSVYICSNE